MDPKSSKTANFGRLLLIVDAGTTYGSIGAIHVTPGQDINEVNEKDITYLHGYNGDICRDTKYNDIVPTTIYYGNSVGDDIVWGWDVSRLVELAHNKVHQRSDRCIRLFKLMLDETEATADVRHNIAKQIDGLIRDGFVREHDDVMVDYFVKWFTFAKELDADKGPDKAIDKGFAHPEFVICVPSSWSVKAYHRWYAAIVKAIRRVWDRHDSRTPPNITTVAEPEAAASYCLSSMGSEVRVGACVLVADNGGGTLEAVTLKKTCQDPIRWEHVCPMSSDTCGGDSQNQVLRSILTEKLKDEDYLGNTFDDITIHSIVESVVQSYESDIKRSSRDPTSSANPPNGFHIQGLKANPEKGFSNHTLHLSQDEWIQVCKPARTGLVKLLDEQHTRVESKQERIDYVVWVGQFSDSPSLRATGESHMNTWSHPPQYIHNRGNSYAVTGGAGLKALKVDMFPPSRFLRASFAIERAVPKQWRSPRSSFLRQHRQFRPIATAPGVLGKDGQPYVFNCLEYFAQKGEEFPPGRKFFFTSTHAFYASENWTAEERIWFTPEGRKVSWYRSGDKQNKDAAELGDIRYDMNGLKEDIYNVPHIGSVGRKLYKITLRVRVEMLESFRHTLRIKARWARELTEDLRENWDGDIDSREEVEGDDVMDIEGVDINVSAVFNLSAV